MPKELIRVSNLCKYCSNPPYPDRVILDTVSFSVFEHDCMVISGKNGSGKTMLMTILAELEPPSSGVVKRFVIDKHQLQIGLVFQDADSQILGDTVEEDVRFGIRHSRLPEAVIQEKIHTVLVQTGLQDKGNLPARSLSGGEKRRLAVAGVLMLDASIIIFDEPFANLDFEGVVQVVQLIEMLYKQGRTLIVLTHELEKILGLANRLLILQNGRLAYDGSPAEALHNGILTACRIRNPLCSYNRLSDLLWNTYE